MSWSTYGQVTVAFGAMKWNLWDFHVFGIIIINYPIGPTGTWFLRLLIISIFQHVWPGFPFLVPGDVVRLHCIFCACEPHAFPRTCNDSLVSCDTSDWQRSICDSWHFLLIPSLLWFFMTLWSFGKLARSCKQTHFRLERTLFNDVSKHTPFFMCSAAYNNQGRKSQQQLQQNFKARIFGSVDLGP